MTRTTFLLIAVPAGMLATYLLRRRPVEATPDVVDVSSDESFPASDPPSWTPTTGMTPERPR